MNLTPPDHSTDLVHIDPIPMGEARELEPDVGLWLWHFWNDRPNLINESETT